MLLITIIIFILYKLHYFIINKMNKPLMSEVAVYFKLTSLKENKLNINLVMLLNSVCLALALQISQKIKVAMILQILIGFGILMVLHFLTIIIIRLVGEKK